MTREEYENAVDIYANMVLRIAVNYCRQIADAEDIVQEVFYKMYRKNIDFNDQEHQKRWLIRATVNECKNVITSSWHRRVDFVGKWSQETDQSYDSASMYMKLNQQSVELYEQQELERGRADRVRRAVCNLPEKYRIVIHLYYFEGYQAKEIAQILNRRETTVQTQLMRARELLKKQLKGEDNYGYAETV